MADTLQAKKITAAFRRHTRRTLRVHIIAAAFVLLYLSSCQSPGEPGPEEPPEFEFAEPFNWQTATPLSVGLDTAFIASATREFHARQSLFSFLIVKDGKLIVEEYNIPFTKFHDYDIRSASKSFISALVGIAVREGVIDSLRQRVLDLLPGYRSSGMDPRKNNITVEHLLTMRAGFDYNEGDDYSHLFTPTADWTKTIIDLPLKFTPGERFSYATIQTHLLSVIIAKRSGMSTLAFANKYLFKPLSIGVRAWYKDPQGNYYGGTGMSFTARDLARFGALYLHNGALDGQQIVPGSWVNESLKPRNVTGSFWGSFPNVNYGYSWWMQFSAEDSVFMAAGYAGQFIMNIPRYNMTIVTTANSDIAPSASDAQFNSIIDIVAQYVLPAARH